MPAEAGRGTRNLITDVLGSSSLGITRVVVLTQDKLNLNWAVGIRARNDSRGRQVHQLSNDFGHGQIIVVDEHLRRGGGLARVRPDSDDLETTPAQIGGCQLTCLGKLGAIQDLYSRAADPLQKLKIDGPIEKG